MASDINIKTRPASRKKLIIQINVMVSQHSDTWSRLHRRFTHMDSHMDGNLYHFTRIKVLPRVLLVYASIDRLLIAAGCTEKFLKKRTGSVG